MYTANQVADWILTRYAAKMDTDDGIDPMTQMKLHKLLYYVQGTFLALHNEPLFGDDILHWQHGPVVRSIFDRFKGEKVIGQVITEDERENYVKIDADSNAQEVLHAVFDNYSDYSAAQLRNMTHHETPWMETAHNDVISQEAIENYFQKEIVEA
ncbi:Panacea domain-containing protein [Leuconostoc mesenteroides]|uniref:Panacea domain-containing protein n=1 Tax=Leuconostoc mesenteroides TaxID=1245 RepID=UPI0030D02E6C